MPDHDDRVKLTVFCKKKHLPKIERAAQRAGYGLSNGGKSAWICARALDAADSDELGHIVFTGATAKQILAAANRVGLTPKGWIERAVAMDAAVALAAPRPDAMPARKAR